MIGTRRARAYAKIFCGNSKELTPDAKIVLGDLERFCFATTPTFDTDPARAALKEGRREVFLRIMHTLNFDFDRYYQLYQEAQDDRREHSDDY